MPEPNFPSPEDREPWRRIVGRGSQRAIHNRFETIRTEDDFEHIADELNEEMRQNHAANRSVKSVTNPGSSHSDSGYLNERKLQTEFFIDETQSVLVKNTSPDIPFEYSINPYRGCEHGCAYCYARPYHEYLGLNSGLDFETKIIVKRNAAELLRVELNKRTWDGTKTIAISGVTDCYQPGEREWRVTRSIIEVLSEAHQAFGMISKNAMMTRDIDLLRPMGKLNLFHANISITTLDQELSRVLEPRTSAPARRLDAVKKLSEAGIPVRVMVAPIIPGLNDIEVPAILKAAAEAGAKAAGHTILRLPYGVKEVFIEWLDRFRPELREKVENYIRNAREGKLSSYQWGERMTGTGKYAEQIHQTFAVFKKKYGLDGGMPAYDTTLFRPPTLPNGQMNLF
jgi:DNA repair photolyase